MDVLAIVLLYHMMDKSYSEFYLKNLRSLETLNMFFNLVTRKRTYYLRSKKGIGD